MYYKVVHNPGQLYSARNIYNRVTYKVGEWVSPTLEYSKLFVFDNLHSAKIFRYGGEEIYSCEVLNPVKEYYGANSSYDIEYFWQFPYIEMNKLMKLPEGTILVDQVKLLEKVYG